MADPNPETLPGYRRRIVIEPGEGEVTAELEDDYHRMVVTLGHGDGAITAIAGEMKRSPWTTCEGARGALADTFLGKRLDDPGFRQTKGLNCTHLYDLATFCIGHAGGESRVTYDISINDPVDGEVVARLYRNGENALEWHLRDGKFVTHEAVAGKGAYEISDWLASLSGEDAEAAKILRWACLVAQGRGFAMPAGMSGDEIGIEGACYTFQPERIAEARRKPGADVDFSADGKGALADRAELFERG